MSQKLEVKVTTVKDKSGKYIGKARVYDNETGKIIHEESTSPQESSEMASGKVLQETDQYFEKLGISASLDFGGAKVSYSEGDFTQNLKNNKPDSPADTQPEPLQTESELEFQTTKIEPKRFIKGVNGKTHVPWPPYSDGLDGTNGRALSEPVPNLFQRKGDLVIKQKGVSNNTWIVMGRDRTGGKSHEGIPESDQPGRRSDVSGYSEYMGAGAIDIVVGRGAPFYISGAMGKSLSPIFRTLDIPKLKGYNLTGKNTESEGGGTFTTTHPGIAMDAARIYISQMTDVDENFGIVTDSDLKNSTVSPPGNIRTPASAVAANADKIRLYARNDVKIVTSANVFPESFNSQGLPIDNIGGIHLIAGNGKPGKQQPIPRGKNLQVALAKIEDQLDDILNIFFSFAQTQMLYNKVLMSHGHNSNAPGMISTPSLTAAPAGAKTMLDHFDRVVMEIGKLGNNIRSYKNTYLLAGKPNYINSEFNTTN